MSTDRTLVVGAGLGGLATALSIASRGRRVTVLERRQAVVEPDAGTQLAPNAFHALDSIGVGKDVRERALLPEALCLRDAATGDPLARMPLTGTYRDRFGAPYAVVDRAGLHAVLMALCRASESIDLVTGCAVAWYEQDARTVTVVSEAGQRFTGTALVAADGIRSTVRRRLVGDGAPKTSGDMVYHAVVPLTDAATALLPGEPGLDGPTAWLAPGRHFVHFVHRTADGRPVLNLGVTHEQGVSEPVVGLPPDTSHVLGLFPDLADSARRLLRLGTGWRTWALCDRDPVERWTDHRVALLGTAAHPMLPYAVQGVSQTLEDAAVVGRLLDCEASEVPSRLSRYAAARRARAHRAQQVSRELGRRLFHPSGGPARTRDAMLTSLTTEELHDKVAWLHGFRDFAEGDES
nr:Salicylate hydroxylase [Streptomyces diastaticus]